MSSQIKPICGTERARLADMIPLKSPISLYVFPSTTCNFKCKYCAHSLGDQIEKQGFRPEMMSMDIFENTIDQVSSFESRLKLLSLTGHGEPLTNKNLPEMIAKAKSVDIAERIEIISNGALLTRETGSAIVEAGLNAIRISLQGLSKAKYHEVTGIEIEFDRIYENLRYFYENRGKCKLYVKIIDIALEPGEKEKFYQIFESITDRMFIEECHPVYDSVNYSQEILKKKTDRYGRERANREVCPLCFYMLAIWPNGDVAPCDAPQKPCILGNVKDDLLTELWGGEKLKEFQLMQLKKQRYLHDRCKVCCAPDDVSHPEDVLDKDAESILADFITT